MSSLTRSKLLLASLSSWSLCRIVSFSSLITSSLSCIAILLSRACLSSFSSSYRIWSSCRAMASLHSLSWACSSSLFCFSDYVSMEFSLSLCSALAFSSAWLCRIAIVALYYCSSFAACSLSCLIYSVMCSIVCWRTAPRFSASWQQVWTLVWTHKT